jgi:hypothetical protein
MEPVPDRIRRILDGAGTALRRAVEVPQKPPEAPRDGLRERLLRRRLDALRVAETTPALRPTPPPEAPLPLLDDDDRRPLEEVVGATVRTTARGSHLYVERRYPLDVLHGRVRLGDVLERALPLRRAERLPGAPPEIDLRSAVYLDVETTGLSGGTGTVAFLVGAARFEGEALVLRQYFMRDFPDEGSLLEAFADDLGGAPLVTFNGRSFDWPLLTTRLRLHRTRVAERPHADLLPPSRRLWAGSLESHALGDLEREVLGVEREDDLPGWMIPEAWFSYLRSRRPARVAAAFRHNEVDIVSMVALGAVVARLASEPTSRRGCPALDHLGTARLLLDHGRSDLARACLEAAVSGGLPEPSPVLRRLLGACHRRAGDLDGAMRAWSAWLQEEEVFDPHPFEELAKACEHRLRDLPRALAYVEEALARCAPGDPRRASLLHRAARLRERHRRAQARG